MKPLSIKEVTDAVRGEIIQKGDSTVITGVSTDTRNIRSGDLFVPLKGETFDGHDYLELAAEKGAAAVLTHNLNKTLPKGVHTIVTGNTLTAMQDLAAWYLSSIPVPVIAVTGSTGKTTTKEFLYHVLSRKYQVLKTQGNYNNEIGLPLTLFHLEPHHQIAVLEMGMSGFGEIRRLATIAPPKAAVITNIGVSHIERLGSRDHIWKAKSEVLEHFDAGCTVFLNDDNDILHREGNGMKENHMPYEVIRFGSRADADYRAEDIRLHGEDGIEYTLYANGEFWPIRLNVPGRHNVSNSLAAIAVGRAFGVSMDDIQEGLLAYTGGSMRLDIFQVPFYDNVKVIDDAYNSSPDSVQAALKILEEMDGIRKIAILGDMLELGSFTQEAHLEVGRAVTDCGSHLLITRGQDSIWVGTGAKQAGMNDNAIFHMSSNAEVVNWLRNHLRNGDRVLIKGSRGMKMEEVVSYLKQGREPN